MTHESSGGNERLKQAGLLQSRGSFIADEVRAKEISIGDAAAAGVLVKDWTVESVEMRIGVGT